MLIRFLYLLDCSTRDSRVILLTAQICDPFDHHVNGISYDRAQPISYCFNLLDRRGFCTRISAMGQSRYRFAPERTSLLASWILPSKIYCEIWSFVSHRSTALPAVRRLCVRAFGSRSSDYCEKTCLSPGLSVVMRDTRSSRERRTASATPFYTARRDRYRVQDLRIVGTCCPHSAIFPSRQLLRSNPRIRRYPFWSSPRSCVYFINSFFGFCVILWTNILKW